jgi:serine/threonine-protein kinase
MEQTPNMRICPGCLTRTEEIICPRDGYRTVEERFFRGKDYDPLIGQVFDKRYRITELIGRGGMGSVYKALNIAMNQTVALKVMNRDLVEDINQVKRFHQEAMASSRLNHPHTIKVFDFGQSEEGLLFIAMEYLSGKILTNVLKMQGRIEPLLAAKIAYQVGQSLVEAHELNIIHRDLKPDNIFLIDVVGEDVFVKVLDFGIAKFLSSGSGELNITKTGIIVGTPRYMSPEQARGEKLDFSSDIYSLSVIMYEMVSGATPFPADTPMAVLMGHISKQPPPFPEGLVPQGLANLIFMCMAKNKSERCSSTREFLAEISAFIKATERDVPFVSVLKTEKPASAPQDDKTLIDESPVLPREKKYTEELFPSRKKTSLPVREHAVIEEEAATMLMSDEELAKLPAEEEIKPDNKIVREDDIPVPAPSATMTGMSEIAPKSPAFKYIFLVFALIIAAGGISLVIIAPWKDKKESSTEQNIAAVSPKPPEPLKKEEIKPPSPPVLPEKKPSVTVSFDSTPQNASVFDDKDVQIGITPFKKDFEPSKNPSKFTFKKQGYQDEIINSILTEGLNITIKLLSLPEEKKEEKKSMVKTDKPVKKTVQVQKKTEEPKPEDQNLQYKKLKQDDEIEYKGLR